MALQELISKKLQLESKWATQALSQKRVTPDMKWMDIEIKNLKKESTNKALLMLQKDFLTLIANKATTELFMTIKNAILDALDKKYDAEIADLMLR